MSRKYTLLIADTEVRITVASRKRIINNWIRQSNRHFSHRRVVIVGLDIKFATNTGRPATLHLSAGNRCLIIKLLHIELPLSLFQFMENPRNAFVAVGIGRKAASLESEYGLICRNMHDISSIAALNWPYLFGSPPTLNLLAQIVLKLRIRRPLDVDSSDWGNGFLTRSQIDYACVESFLSFWIGFLFLFDIVWPEL